MTRNRASAKAAGSRFERLVADHSAEYLGDDRVDRKVKTGAKDKGDIANLRSAHGERIVLEAKDTTRTTLGVWANEVAVEKQNDGAPIGAVVHKRVGFGEAKVGGSWVTMTLDDFLRLIGGPPKG
jgi:hypothetical protein